MRKIPVLGALVLIICLFMSPVLAAVTEGSVSDLKEKFNSDKASTRVIALLSPT